MASGLHYQDPISLDSFELAQILVEIPRLECLHSSIIDTLWCDFSTTWYCAGSMGTDIATIENFKRYLFTDDRS